MSAPQGERRREVPLLPGTPVDGRFRVMRLLGRWRLGTAYVARIAATTETCTLITMRLHAGGGDRFARWVRAEVERVRPLRGAGLIVVRDGGATANDEGYVVLEPWTGLHLVELAQAQGGLGTEMAVRLAESLARRVATAHAAGVVLGDLRPSTVMVAGETLSVLDMGLGRGLSEQLHRPPAAAQAYTSPARSGGAPAVIADDLYSVGAILYFLLTHQAPPEGEPGAPRLATPPSWVAALGGLGAYIDPVVLRAMAARPQDRFATAAELAAALTGVREVFALGPEAREVLGLPASAAGAFAQEATHPHLLHEVLGVPPVGTPAPRTPAPIEDRPTLPRDPTPRPRR